MNDSDGKGASSTGSTEGATIKDWIPIGEWWRSNQNKFYVAVGVAAGYLLGTVVGELHARRREDTRWKNFM